MYIAFKWLLSLTLIMWLAMCSIDAYVKNNIMIMTEEGINIRPTTMNFIKNESISTPSQLEAHLKKMSHVRDSSHNMAYIHFFMFVAGALVVTVYNNINDIIVISKNEFIHIVESANPKKFSKRMKTIAAIVRQYFKILCNMELLRSSLQYIMCKSKNALSIFIYKSHQKQRINLLLLKKLKEISEEKKNLAHLLLTAIRENKNIRMQYQMENVAKKRLIQHIETTERVIKENKSRYVSFQQLYLVTHQQNSLLKTQIKKIAKDKEEIEKKIIDLISEIYKSKNSELMSYCCRFIVQTKHNLLNTDASAEIQKFLFRPRESSSRQWHFSDYPDLELQGVNSWLRCSSSSNITGVLDNKDVEPLSFESPKLKGLPGECVWTIKDKDGLVEKLYECDFGSDVDTGDTIRRIREYSVYHDKDCLLDFSNSTSSLSASNETVVEYNVERCNSADNDLNSPLRSQKFLTDSEAFKKFMQNSDSVVNKTMLLSKTRLQSA